MFFYVHRSTSSQSNEPLQQVTNMVNGPIKEGFVEETFIKEVVQTTFGKNKSDLPTLRHQLSILAAPT